MSEKEQDLLEQVDKLKENNINLRFNTVEEKLTEISELLKKLTETTGANYTLLEKRVRDIEDKQKNCSVTTLSREVKRFSLETNFLRHLFKNPLWGIIALTTWIVIVVIVLVAFGFEPILKLVTMFR